MTELAKKWLKKYYSIPANKCKKKDALAHSLKKWEGLQFIKKYKLKTDSEGNLQDTDDYVLMISGGSCALCVWYFDDTDDLCEKCPLYAVRGVPCDSNLKKERVSPFHKWMEHKNPLSMIKLLKKAKRLSKKVK